MDVPARALLGFAIWTVLVLMVGVGIQRWSLILTGKAQLSSFPADEPHGPDFYRRAMRAHANCVENLPIFGAVVFATYAVGLQSAIVDSLAVTALGARVLQTLTHVSSGSNMAVGIRFGFFAIQIVCFVWMAVCAALQAAS
ncbi:MAG: MAPEG family protein [Caulobacterales bacterium]